MNTANSNIFVKITNFLSQPYPFYFKGTFLRNLALILFVMTLLFSYFIEPFEVYVPEHKITYFWISFIHACSPVAVLALFSLFKIPSETEENWNVRKEILLIALYLLLIGIVQFLIRDIIYNNPNNWSWRYFYEEIRNTFFIGTLFATILIPLNFNRLHTKNSKAAKALNVSSDFMTVHTNSTVFIETQVKSDDFNLNIDRFLFAKADGNYVNIYIEEKDINKLLKRITLKELESVLKPFPNIIKTHRSYLVNLNHVNSVTGNAQGYALKVNYYHDTIPVSRKMIDFFDAIMTKN